MECERAPEFDIFWYQRGYANMFVSKSWPILQTKVKIQRSRTEFQALTLAMALYSLACETAAEQLVIVIISWLGDRYQRVRDTGDMFVSHTWGQLRIHAFLVSQLCSLQRGRVLSR